MMKFTTIAKAKKETGLSYLGGVATSAKIDHSRKYSHQYTYGIYLSASNLSGYNVCSHSTPECKMGCLATSGRSAVDIFSGRNIISSCRIKKTKLLFENTAYFMQWAIAEIQQARAKAIKDGYYFSVRLNCTSDIDWTKILVEGKNIFNIFPDVNFYDYTKSYLKFENKPKNYHLTYSYTGRNEELCKALLQKGFNVATVFNVRNEIDLPTQFLGYQVVNGDLTDARFLDKSPCIVGLKWKRIANRVNEKKVLNSCFVVQPIDIRCSNVQKEINEMVIV